VATPWTTKLREQRVLIDSDGVKLKQKVKLYLTTDEKMWLKNNVEKEGGGCLHTLPEAKRLLKLGHRLRKVQALYIIIIINIYIYLIPITCSKMGPLWFPKPFGFLQEWTVETVESCRVTAGPTGLDGGADRNL
jgi:hypothetical protein